MVNKTVLEVLKNVMLGLLLTILLLLGLRLSIYNGFAAWSIMGVFIFTFIYLNLFSWSFGQMTLAKLDQLENKINNMGYMMINIEKQTDLIEKKVRK